MRAERKAIWIVVLAAAAGIVLGALAAYFRVR